LSDGNIVKVVIYTNDEDVIALSIVDASSNYLFRRFITRAPLSLNTLVVSTQQVGVVSDFLLSGLTELTTVSLNLNQIPSFSPALFLGNHPNLTSVAVSNNKLSSTQVDDIFNYLYANSPELLSTTGVINTFNQTPSAPPTAASLTARNAFTAAGWTLITD
jgi:hypothetical protein